MPKSNTKVENQGKLFDPSLHRKVADQRAILRPKDPTTFYADSHKKVENGPSGSTIYSMLDPIRQMGGLLFPYTPLIQQAGGTAEYDSSTYRMTHSNYTNNAYKQSTPSDIVLNAPFTAQSQDEAVYALAVINFLRYVTKSHFGESNIQKAGTPPPVLLFDYLGPLQYQNVPVIVSSFMYNLPENVDYVPAAINALSSVWSSMVPVSFEISVVLKVQYNPYKLRKEFDLDKFKTGQYLSGSNPSNRGYI